jgi:hypothetical protein
MTDRFYCPGCRQEFIECSPTGDELVLVCPIAECRRPLWMRGAPGDGFELFTPSVPDLTAARFVVDCSRLLDHGVELLLGPSDRMHMLAELLNRLDPPAAALPDLVKSFIVEQGHGCSFVPGKALIFAASQARINKGETDVH